jgi:hypothetical protein
MSLIKIKYECEFDTEKEAKDALEGVKLIINQTSKMMNCKCDTMINVIPSTDSWITIGELKPLEHLSGEYKININVEKEEKP